MTIANYDMKQVYREPFYNYDPSVTLTKLT